MIISVIDTYDFPVSIEEDLAAKCLSKATFPRKSPLRVGPDKLLSQVSLHATASRAHVQGAAEQLSLTSRRAAIVDTEHVRRYDVRQRWWSMAFRLDVDHTNKIIMLAIDGELTDQTLLAGYTALGSCFEHYGGATASSTTPV